MPDAPSLNQDRFFRLVVAADLSEFSIARQFIQEIGHVARLSEARLFDFQVAVSEAIANALENARSEAELCVWLLPDRLVAEIASQGAFQPGIYEDSAQRRRVLGLPIMASLADQVHVSCVASGGAQVAGGKTHVSLTFFLEGHGEDSDQPSHSDHGEAVGGRDALLESLLQSEERFRQIFEDHNAVMLLIDPDTGAIVDSNVAAARFYGRSKDELRTMAIKDLNELPAEQVAEEYRRAAAEERNHFMFPHRAADGETRWVEVHSAPIDTRNGRLLFSTIYDITERKVGEAEQERLRQIEKVLLEELRAQNEELEAQSEALQAQNEKLQAAQEKTALLLEERSSLLLRLQHALVDIPRELPGVKFAHLYRSATREAVVGGDFYDVFGVLDGRIGLLIGDVCGHGVEAVRTATLAKDTVQAFARQFHRPQQILRETNQLLVEKSLPGFVTAFLGFLDLESGTFTYSAAGHPPPLVAADGDVTLLQSGGPPLGVFVASRYEDYEMAIARGSLLLFYTDGITEARRDGDIFGEDRLVEALGRMRGREVEVVPSLLLEETLGFSGGLLRDDAALLAVNYLGKPSPGEQTARPEVVALER